jgi:hypothetical protein
LPSTRELRVPRSCFATRAGVCRARSRLPPLARTRTVNIWGCRAHPLPVRVLWLRSPGPVGSAAPIRRWRTLWHRRVHARGRETIGRGISPPRRLSAATLALRAPPFRDPRCERVRRANRAGEGLFLRRAESQPQGSRVVAAHPNRPLPAHSALRNRAPAVAVDRAGAHHDTPAEPRRNSWAVVDDRVCGLVGGTHPKRCRAEPIPPLPRRPERACLRGPFAMLRSASADS